MSELEKLRKKLEKAEKEEDDNKWQQLRDAFNKIGEWAVGKEFIQFYTRHSWSVFKVTDYKEQYFADISGWRGDWDKHRYFVFIGEIFSMRANDIRKSWSTAGDVEFNDIKGVAEIGLQSMQHTLGIPLEPKQQWGGAWKRFLELGEVKFEQILLNVGQKAYESRDYEAARKVLSNFQVFLRLAPEGMFDELKQHYIKRVKLAAELYEKYSEDRVIKCEAIKWDTIFKF